MRSIKAHRRAKRKRNASAGTTTAIDVLCYQREGLVKIVSLFSLTLLLASTPGLAQKVNTDFDESVDFPKFKTYGWRRGRINTRLPNLDNSLVDKHIRAAVDSHLASKGLQLSSDKPDVWVSDILGARNMREIDTVPAGWRGWGTRRVAYPVTRGTLVIDLKDGAKNELVWRATCMDTASDPVKFERRIDNDVRKAFEKFPPKKK